MGAILIAARRGASAKARVKTCSHLRLMRYAGRMRRLKIAFLSRWYWEENRRAGGAPASGPVQQLAEAMAALGHEVVVLSQSPDVDGLERSRVGALEVWLSPREKRRPGWAAVRDKLAKLAFKHRKVHSDALDLCAFLERRGPFDVLWAHCEEPDGLIAAIAAPQRQAVSACAGADPVPALPLPRGPRRLRGKAGAAARLPRGGPCGGELGAGRCAFAPLRRRRRGEPALAGQDPRGEPESFR